MFNSLQIIDMYILITLLVILILLAGIQEYRRYTKAKHSLIDYDAFRLLSILSYLILIQILLVLGQFLMAKNFEVHPLWISIFIFYGPHVFLLLSYYRYKEKQPLFRNYFKDYYYLAISFFTVFICIFFLSEGNIAMDQNMLHYFLYVFIIVYLLFYAIKSFFILKEENNLLNQAPLENFKLIKFLSYLISFLIIFSSITVISLVYNNDPIVFFIAILLSLICFYFTVLLLRYRVSTSFFFQYEANGRGLDYNEVELALHLVKAEEANKPEEENKDPYDGKYEKVKLSDETLAQIDIKVRQVILKEKAYLNADFKISELAHKTKISRYYLAQYFTYIHQMSFREYINSLRINVILETINSHEDKKQFTANELFYQSAFNSKASFFKSFKQVTGMTPFEYIKLI